MQITGHQTQEYAIATGKVSKQQARGVYVKPNSEQDVALVAEKTMKDRLGAVEGAGSGASPVGVVKARRGAGRGCRRQSPSAPGGLSRHRHGVKRVRTPYRRALRCCPVPTFPPAGAEKSGALAAVPNGASSPQVGRRNRKIGRRGRQARLPPDELALCHRK